MSRRRSRLTERDWDCVFALRCKSKRGEGLTEDELRFVTRAFHEDSARYSALGPAVFEATKPVGAR